MEKCKCWQEENAARPFASGRCSGTKELDLCDCGGDETKCDFYPEKRNKALEEKGKLKPCPFCGHEKLKITKKRSGNYRRTGDYIQIICNKCKARGPIFEAKYDVKLHGWGDSLYAKANPAVTARAEQLAVEAWNRRVNDA